MSIGAAAVAPTAAEAQRYYGNGYNNGGYYDRGYYDRGSNYDRGYNARRYDNRYYYRDRRCSNGGTGTVIGAIAGGLLGRTVDTRGDRLGGTLIGGVAGALAGRAIDKSGNPGYCR